MRKLFVIVVVLILLAGGFYVAAGFAAGPSIDIGKPARMIGLATPFDVSVDAPDGVLSSVAVAVEQNGVSTTVLTLGPTNAAEGGTVVRVTGEVGRSNVPALASGPARLVVTATRPVAFGIRQVSAAASKDLTVRLERPRLTVLSTHHYVNQGGAEAVVYRVDPDDVESGVRVGSLEYRGYPASRASGEGVQITDPAVRVAFFALLPDQDVNTPMKVFARDEAGNSADVDFDHRVFPKPIRHSRIELSDAFIDRVVPAVLAGTDEVHPEGSTLEKFLVLNGELRRLNAGKIASFAAQTAPEMLWKGETFHSFTNSAVESSFADARTYIYKGQEVDHQTHLGFDLASYAGTSIVAANRGKVLFADELGIYGRAVIIDHGMGLQSLYAHLSSIGVKPGDFVDKGQEIGRSGMTGMAAGDHLHFTMLLDGRMVNPIEWWDPHWIEDRILRKLRSAR